MSTIELTECFKGCDEILKLDTDRKRILSFVESRMNRIAPNLCAIVGSSIAAQLVGLAGGLMLLAQIPACNVQVMGQEKKNLAGLSTINANSMPHVGILQFCDIVQVIKLFITLNTLKNM